MKVALATGMKIVRQDMKVFSINSKMPSGCSMNMTTAGLCDVSEVGSFNEAKAAEKAKAKVTQDDADSELSEKGKEEKAKAGEKGKGWWAGTSTHAFAHSAVADSIYEHSRTATQRSSKAVTSEIDIAHARTFF